MTTNRWLRAATLRREPVNSVLLLTCRHNTSYGLIARWGARGGRRMRTRESDVRRYPSTADRHFWRSDECPGTSIPTMGCSAAGGPLWER
jgi:hypothetical protein